MASNVKKCINILKEGNQLDAKAAEFFEAAFNEIMMGKATDAQIACLLTSLSFDKVTSDIVAACARSMRNASLKCNYENCIDIVGTGGDGIDTFNVSTVAGLLVAACGGKVMKHGNRSNSSKCGSADLLEALGARLDVNGTSC